jgi:hypothetical protein
LPQRAVIEILVQSANVKPIALHTRTACFISVTLRVVAYSTLNAAKLAIQRLLDGHDDAWINKKHVSVFNKMFNVSFFFQYH